LNQAWKVFSGYVTEARSPHFLCKDEGVKLSKDPIVQTLQQVTPQDVIRFALGKAGITSMELDSTQYQRKDRFVIAGETAADLIRRVNTTWGLTHDYYFIAEKFFWNPPKPVAGPVYSYQYGENILSLEFATDREPQGQRAAGSTSGSGKLTTVVSPFINHSQEIEILWPEVKSTRFMTETVRHFLNENGALRTELYFRELEAA
jgi:hypothetical protein